MFKNKIVMMVAIFFLVSSPADCMATLEHAPAANGLCQYIEFSGWDKNGARKEGEADYSFRVTDLFAWVVVGPLQKVHWIEITAYTAGKLVGYPVPPMIYDPAEAELEISGKKIKALPRAWISKQVHGKYMPADEVSIPINLNGDGKNAPDSFFIALPINITGPKTEYIFRPGTILLDGVRYPLPVYKSCYTPGKWWWNPIN